TLSLLSGSTRTLLGCLRNCESVARAAIKTGSRVAVIPAGERWEDGSLRPCFEDLVGAGAVIKFLRGTLSPEAIIARSAFEIASGNLHEYLRGCSSGKEKIARREESDVKLASALNASSCVPLLKGGAFISEASGA
ncbi:MAG TPA: 2-phosphosulfolactate phosphatase, partial [Pyrinomonadaceae bacterium]|nr:2-phosphosulfolactate phosphatase [Pyrinomonadaceae bacterium]